MTTSFPILEIPQELLKSPGWRPVASPAGHANTLQDDAGRWYAWLSERGPICAASATMHLAAGSRGQHKPRPILFEGAWWITTGSSTGSATATGSGAVRTYELYRLLTWEDFATEFGETPDEVRQRLEAPDPACEFCDRVDPEYDWGSCGCIARANPLGYYHGQLCLVHARAQLAPPGPYYVAGPPHVAIERPTPHPHQQQLWPT